MADTNPAKKAKTEQEESKMNGNGVDSSKIVHLLDYGAGNVRSVRNAIIKLGYTIVDITSPEQIEEASMIVFPGVGSFGSAMKTLHEKGYFAPLKQYLAEGKPYFGICLGMQTLFEASEETPGVEGLGLIPGTVQKFDATQCSVPSIGWNGIIKHKASEVVEAVGENELVYFVHSFRALPSEENKDWVLTTTTYNGQYISSIQKGNIVATQFHPEKSGQTGLKVFNAFLEKAGQLNPSPTPLIVPEDAQTRIAKRVIACLDVRSNDQGDLVVTKGDQYDVRESAEEGQGRGEVRNLGKPVALCSRYYEQGADEVTFLNITSFRQCVIGDLPMLQVLERSSETVFVPLTVGGGIRDYTDKEGTTWTALDVASRYFRAGADKISIGSDAVYAAENFLEKGASGESSIEQISKVYGAQAVVVSIDPRRVYVDKPEDAPKHTVLELPTPGPDGKRYCWYQATVKGGREGRDIDAVALARACQELGAGEILLNCVDSDGQCNGYDLILTKAVVDAVTIPVIASSGAGAVQHFSEVFRETDVQAALAAGIFHREEVEISSVKDHLVSESIPARAMSQV
mmetsp:Transcript_10850/g.14105  ORF Transcript_10850/g.14105 Transcript_10850/m.14105 type:complete len:572 (+) Transcript_10850:78-1793(+)